jgi:uncharacterized delta-60 repeat protein
LKSHCLSPDSANHNDGGGHGTLRAAIEASDSHRDVNGICFTLSLKLFDRLPVVAALAGMFCVFSLTALAAPGDPDTTFAGTGIVRVGFGLGDDRANGAAVQSDGKIVVVGSDNFSVARYNTDGSLDTSFDGDGKVVTTIGSGNSVASAVKVQGDGKIVVAGYTEITPNSFAVVRYNTDGSLDSSFGSEGKVVTTPEMTGLSVVTGNALAIQADGKIVVAGSGENAGKTNFAVLRYNADGSLDSSFDADGIVTTAIGSGEDVGNAVTILAGKIIVAGSSFNGLRNIFALVRYNSNGSLDTSFDLDGIVTTEIQFSNGDEIAMAVAIQIGNLTTLPDKIVVAGSSSGITKLDFAVVRYNLDGSLDTSFDADGKVTTPIGAEDDVGQALAVQGSGNAPRKITVAGSSDNGAKTDFAVVRYNADGSLDTSFDLDGIVTTPVDTNDNAGAALVIQTDGKVVVAGSSTNDSNHFLDDFALVRYNSDGSLDTSFDADGKRIDNIGDMGGDAKSLAIQTDGKIVVAGSSSFAFAVFRANSDGSADTSFDGDGRVMTHIGTSSVDQGLAVALQADNKIVVAGFSVTASVQSFAIARYNPNGLLDLTFNGDGVATTLIDEASAGTAVAVQADGKIVLAGLSLKGGSTSIAVVRYNTNGSLDASFGGDGVVVTSIGNDAVAIAVAIQTDGRIVVAGSAGGLFALVRYNTNGSLDTSFDGDGIVTTAIDAGLDGGSAVAIQTDGRIVVSGFASGLGAVARYNSNGTTDLTFNGSGKLIDPDAAPGTGVAIQTDGKILVVGTSTNSSNFSADFAVIRYNSDGTRDSSYGNDGGLAVDVSLGGSDVASAIDLDLTGRAVVAGTSAGSIGVIRLLGGPPTTFANISTRLRVETGDNVLIGGFIITGSQPKKVLMRAIGPSLPLAGLLANPTLELHDGAGTLITSNDNWMDAPNKQEIIDSTIQPTNDLESAILMTLEPGLYTAIVRGANDTTGIALVEAYDLDLTADSILANISTRGLVQTADNVMIGGIIIVGTDAQEVLLRAIGPSLPVAGALADPTLELHDKDGVTIASNDDWRRDQEADIMATMIPPTDDAESAILMTLTPDAYTAIVRGKDDTTGIALFEAYQLDN